MTNRREFLTGTAWMGAVALAAGCATAAEGESGAAAAKGTPMGDFRVAPIKLVRIAFIGIGSRGSAAVKRVSKIPGCEATVLCDLRKEAVAENQKWLKANAKGAKRYYAGKDDSWKGACDDPGVDVVYIATPAGLHPRIALYAMRAGKHVLTEVPASYRIEELWEIVETSETTRRHCMMLENCCYGEMEMFAWNLCHQGVLGKITHAEGGYIHNLTERHLESSFRNRNNTAAIGYRRGNGYPTHPLGPICQYLDINHGDRMSYIVSMSSGEGGWSDYIAAIFPPDDWRAKMKLDRGDMNTSLIKTAKGRSILLQHDTTTPRPYSRINLVQGSRGCFYDYPPRLSLSPAGKPASHVKDWLAKEEFEATKAKYQHPLWRSVGEIAKKVGGHGGMDFIMDLRWAYCLQNGLPLDMDVYDLASWSCICECSMQSDRGGSVPIEIPDFTRGAWKTAKPRAIGDVDLGKMGLDAGGVKAADGQLSV